MYGRKLSAESRAKISATMTGRARKRHEEKDRVQLTEATKEALRAKAVGSRLLRTDSNGQNERVKNEEERIKEAAEERIVEEVLRGVRSGERPPESVIRVVERDQRLKTDRKGRKGNRNRNSKWNRKGKGEGKELDKCARCQGSGFIECAGCVKAFGVASGRCDVCFGAGSVFCDACLGVGAVVVNAIEDHG